MFNQKAYALGVKRSCIRELFEYGNRRAAEVGRENIFDYSLGNPSTPAPDAVRDAILDIVAHEDPVSVHGYTSAAGAAPTREAIARAIREGQGGEVGASDIFITEGAALALTSTLSALTVSPESEFVVLAPYFPEYAVFIDAAGAKMRVVPADTAAFQIDMDALASSVNAHTQGVIINSPNNPSGVVYTRETLTALAALLSARSKEYGHPIYLLSDEPYRALVYGGVEVPYLPSIYPDTVVCTSYSKSLSLPGERIGYVAVAPCVTDHDALLAAIGGAARALGHVCAPSLLQKVIERCASVPPSLEVYDVNRTLLYDALTEYGYRCAKPDGAFYLFVEAPGGDAAAFSEKAKAYDLLIVPGGDFGCPSHFRLSYCVTTDMIRRSLPLFARLMEEYRRG